MFYFVAIHEKAFISFAVFAVIHMFLTCYLFRRGRPKPWDSNVSTHHICGSRGLNCFVGKIFMEMSTVEHDNFLINVHDWSLLLHPTHSLL